MTRYFFAFSTLAATLVSAVPVVSQTFPTNDPVLRQMWTEGIEKSQTEVLAQVLFDEIGPRLTGSPGHEKGNEWLVSTIIDAPW